MNDLQLSCDCISEAAAQVISLVPCCAASASELVRNIHVIASDGEDYDNSYSEQEIPFTIFVSVPRAPSRRTLLRVAEGIVHETMHLQLSLLEGNRPLVDPGIHWHLYSPWKRSNRQTEGILHGLYVFGVLSWMWRQIRTTSPAKEDRDFAEKRISEIAGEVQAVDDVRHSPALTVEGRIFATALLRNIEVQ